jgi:hypothetical protein
VLFHGAGTDAEFRSDFFIAAALNQQVKNLLVAAGDFDLIQVQHVFCLFFLLECRRVSLKHVFRQSFAAMINRSNQRKHST